MRPERAGVGHVAIENSRSAHLRKTVKSILRSTQERQAHKNVLYVCYYSLLGQAYASLLLRPGPTFIYAVYVSLAVRSR